MAYKEQNRDVENILLSDSKENRQFKTEEQLKQLIENSQSFNENSGSNIASNYGQYKDSIVYTEHSLVDDSYITREQHFPKTQIEEVFENSHFYIERDEKKINKISPDRNQGQILIPHEFYFADDNLTYQISRKEILLNGHLTGYSIDHSSTGGLAELYNALKDAGYTKTQEEFINDLKDSLMNWHDL